MRFRGPVLVHKPSFDIRIHSFQIQFAAKLKSRQSLVPKILAISLVWPWYLNFELNKNEEKYGSEIKKPMATLCSGSSLQNGASLVSLGSAKNFPWKARAPLHRWRNGGLYGGWQYIDGAGNGGGSLETSPVVLLGSSGLWPPRFGRKCGAH